MKPVKFEVEATDEKLMSQEGLALVGQLVATTDLRKRLNSLQLPGHPSPDIKHGDIVITAIGLVSMGKTDFDDIEEFREDPFFRGASMNWRKTPGSAKSSEKRM